MSGEKNIYIIYKKKETKWPFLSGGKKFPRPNGHFSLEGKCLHSRPHAKKVKEAEKLVRPNCQFGLEKRKMVRPNW